MTHPIVFISHSKVKEGKLVAFREMSVEVFRDMEASKPDTLLHYGYVNEDRSELSFVHVFGDTEAMDAHFAGAGDRSAAAADYIDTYRSRSTGRRANRRWKCSSRLPASNWQSTPAGSAATCAWQLVEPETDQPKCGSRGGPWSSRSDRAP